MKPTDVAMAPVNMLTFLLGCGAIVVAILFGSGSCNAPVARPQTRPPAAAQEPNDAHQRIDDLRTHVDQRIDDLRMHVDQRFDHVDQRFDHVDQRFDHVDQRFDDLRDLIVGQGQAEN